jgi:hypothetical protein
VQERRGLQVDERPADALRVHPVALPVGEALEPGDGHVAVARAPTGPRGGVLRVVGERRSAIDHGDRLELGGGAVEVPGPVARVPDAQPGEQTELRRCSRRGGYGP